jgi:succinate-semialdehyde dehydrogenase / glutarate-semialdehyde dehydrogenase
MESATMKIRNPRSGALDYEITPLSADALHTLSSTLRDRQRDWAALTQAARSAVLNDAADAIERHGPAIAEALTIDTGRAAISHIEVAGTVRAIRRWAVNAAAVIAGHENADQPTAIPGITTSTRLIPFSLVGVIAPWNFPLTLALIDAIPALAAGCAVIIKPSEVTPRFIVPLVAALAEVPALPLAIVEGDGVTGAALIPLVDYIAFTGSVATGRIVGEAAARAFIPASLELGGKDPMIVLASADPAHAAQIALRASVVNTGQACQSIERVYVARAIAEPFLAALVAAATAVRLNYPDIRTGDIGPFIFEKQAEIVQTQIDDAVARGATILTGGTVETLGGGLYLRPTVLSDVDETMMVITAETFGPVVPVTIFDSVDEAVMLANNGIYGLSAAVIGGTTAEAESVGERLRAGGVSINDGALTSMIWEAEKSSFCLSGLGPSRMGDSGMMRFFRKQALIRQSGTALPMAAYAEDAG